MFKGMGWMNILNPIYDIANPGKNRSTDQAVGRILDPAGFFGKKDSSSVFGPSKLDKNLMNYSEMKADEPTYTRLGTNQSYTPSASSYAGMTQAKKYY